MNRSITVPLVVLVFAAFCFLCIRHEAPMIQQDVLMRTERTLAENKIGVPAGSLTVDGRDVSLSGIVGSPVISKQAQDIADSVNGVRIVKVTAQQPPADASTHVAPPPPPAPAPVQVETQKKVDAVLQSKIVEFNTGSAELTAVGRNTLDAIVPILAASPSLLCSINGYTDSQGDKQENMALSDRRASATKDYLVGKGIAADRLTAAGFGEANPIASNETPEGRRQNRRIEFLLKEK